MPLSRFPQTAGEFFERGLECGRRLEAFKQEVKIADYGWYPYGSLSALPVVSELMGEAYPEIAGRLSEEPVADVGCGDGDFAALFADLGVEADAIDHRESNFNQMRGVERLSAESAGRLRAYDLDLDAGFELPRRQYGLALFLGTLYHLKNPFYVMERLAEAAAYCVLSTRIAQVTPDRAFPMESEPVAYLLGAREANNDPTNFWIFSYTGLRRLIERTGWLLVSERRVGCREGSDPSSPAADERIFALLRSRVRFPELHVRPLDGWHEVEEESRRWTAKRFGLEVLLPAGEPAREFALRFAIPEDVSARAGAVTLECRIGGKTAGTIRCEAPGVVEFRGVFPPGSQDGPSTLEFEVRSPYAHPEDRRELGVVVPLLDPAHVNTARIPFRIS